MTQQSETQGNLTKHDKTRFLERDFTVVENAGHSLRLIKRDDARQAISIKWDDLSALRELITLALDDGPMVIGLDMSGQSAQNAATAMRDACVAQVRQRAAKRLKEAAEVEDDDYEYSRALACAGDQLEEVAVELESLTLDHVKQEKESK